MVPFQNADGGVIQSVREYDILPDTTVRIGQVVIFDFDQLVVPAAEEQETSILGIAAESHSGEADALDPRANGTRIKVYDGPGLICRSAAPQFAATGGTATTVTATFTEKPAYLDGHLKLVEKAPGSANTDAVGTVKRVAGYDYNDTTKVATFTVAAGGAASAGDRYAYFPPIGHASFFLNAERSGLSFKTSGISQAIKPTGRIEETNEILTMARLHEMSSSSS